MNLKKIEINCPYCKINTQTFDHRQFKELSLHIRSHKEIPLVSRHVFLDETKKKLTSVGNYKKGLVKKMKSSSGNRNKNFKLALHRKLVVSALKEISVEDYHIDNVNKIGSVEAINIYISKELKTYHPDLIKKKIHFTNEKMKWKFKKKHVVKSIRVIYTPMGNKR